METPESSTERPPFDPSRLHYQSWGSYVKTWVFQFTIRSFVVWISVICLVLGNIVTGAMLLRSQEELKRAERETGFLVYDDATKIHVTRVPVPGRGVWQFRVHLPEGRQYRIRHCVNAIPESGYPEIDTESVLDQPNDGGDLLLTFVLKEDLDGVWCLDRATERTIFTSGLGLSHGQNGSSRYLPDCDWINASQHYPGVKVREIPGNRDRSRSDRYFVCDAQGIELSAQVGHVSQSPDEPLELLRYRVVEVDGPQRPRSVLDIDYDTLEQSAVFPAEADGIMFWIEPITASQADGTRQANN